MTKIKLNLQEFGELWKRDDIVSINRDVDVGEHLPQDIIGKGAEFTLLRKISNAEFKKLWEASNRVIKNMFIHSSDEIGIEKYIQLIDLEITGDLEEKRKKVFLEWNRQTIWTHRTLNKWLDNAVGEAAHEVILFYDDYEIEFVILMDKAVEHDRRYLMKNLRQIIPANLGFSWTLRYINPVYYGLYAVIDREKTMYQRLETEFNKENRHYYGMANFLTEKEITFLFPEVWFIADDGMNVKRAFLLSGEEILWG